MDIEKLQKKRGSRLAQETYKIVCQDPDKYIRATRTIKSSEEVGSGLNEFVHVALGTLKKFKKPCVIKVHFTESRCTKNEIDLMARLKKCPYVVHHICTYSCLDDTKRWMESLMKPQHTCGDGKSRDKLTFIIMEYITDGDLITFIKKASHKQIKALFIQSAVDIMEMGKTYGVRHGDLNVGNILISLEKPSTPRKI